MVARSVFASAWSTSLRACWFWASTWLTPPSLSVLVVVSVVVVVVGRRRVRSGARHATPSNAATRWNCGMLGSGLAAAGARSGGGIGLRRIRRRHPGDAVDVLHRRHQARDVIVAAAASGEHESGSLDRIPEPAVLGSRVLDLDVRRYGAGEIGQPDVLREDPRQLLEDALPVEAAGRELRDGLDPGIVDALEGRVGREALGAGGGLGRLHLERRDLVFLSSTFLPKTTMAVTPTRSRARAAERRRRRVRRCASAGRAAALLGRDQVDRAHRYESSPRP